MNENKKESTPQIGLAGPHLMSETCCDTEESYAETATVNVFELSTSSVKEMMHNDAQREQN